MTGECPYCGGNYSVDQVRLTFDACCEEMAAELEENRDDEASMRFERERVENH